MSCRRGEQRRVSVYKSKKKKDNKKENGTLAFLELSEQSNEVLQELFTTYPPDDAARINTVDKHLEKFDARIRKKDDIFQKPSMNKAEIAKKVESLSLKLEKAANLRKVLLNVILHMLRSH